MKLAWCPESGPANWTENLNKKLLNGQRCTWTTMLKASENGYHGASPHPNLAL